MNEKSAETVVFIAATGNRHKVAEIAAFMRFFGIEILSKDEAGVADFEIAETGATFEENAYIKADAVLACAGKPVIADDSGLMVDALKGAPGVHSARFSESGTDEDNNAKLLALLKDVPEGKRTAKFVSVITILYPDGTAIVARGECAGRILREPKGANGFGYDPLFVPLAHDRESRTFAELSMEEKNAISHRAKALAALREKLIEAGYHGKK
ncbi:MAG: RdgB/HAM1 family non-canonical purine NTP pyrophosphatase [Clostridiales Family XIII bacterium]|jgi:XTP/dITP diphosphohydrolase|nr:RdgB/HAM1 family non-canonical purine NTP pyrophosphatase [Clostridiales Family XIII bacterium]